MLGLSVSYVNQLENDQRPLTVSVLMRLTSTFDLEVGFFAPETDARLLAELQQVFAENPEARPLTGGELDDLLSRAPAAARLLIHQHRRLRAADDQLDQLTAGFAGPAATPRTAMP